MSKTTQSEPLTGKALLKKLKDISHLSRTEKAKACGYVTTKDNKTRVSISRFMDAILEAKGISLDSGREKSGGGGREASYRVRVHKNGQIIIGASYTQAMHLEPGDEFILKPGYKHIHLTQVE